MARDLDYIILQLYVRTPAPCRDYCGLTVTETEVILNIWNITHGPHVYPKRHKCSMENFEVDKFMQVEIRHLFGRHVSDFLMSLSRDEHKLQNLPTKLFLRVIKFLAARDILNLSQTSKIMFERCEMDNTWKVLFRKLMRGRLERLDFDTAKLYGWKETLQQKLLKIKKYAKNLNKTAAQKESKVYTTSKTVQKAPLIAKIPPTPTRSLTRKTPLAEKIASTPNTSLILKVPLTPKAPSTSTIPSIQKIPHGATAPLTDKVVLSEHIYSTLKTLIDSSRSSPSKTLLTEKTQLATKSSLTEKPMLTSSTSKALLTPNVSSTPRISLVETMPLTESTLTTSIEPLFDKVLPVKKKLVSEKAGLADKTTLETKMLVTSKTNAPSSTKTPLTKRMSSVTKASLTERTLASTSNTLLTSNTLSVVKSLITERTLPLTPKVPLTLKTPLTDRTQTKVSSPTTLKTPTSSKTPLTPNTFKVPSHPKSPFTFQNVGKAKPAPVRSTSALIGHKVPSQNNPVTLQQAKTAINLSVRNKTLKTNDSFERLKDASLSKIDLKLSNATTRLIKSAALKFDGSNSANLKPTQSGSAKPIATNSNSKNSMVKK